MREKIVMIFCQKAKCVSISDCYCCLSQKPEVCYNTMEFCRSNCPVCDPVCRPPVQRVVEDISAITCYN
ncbi:hypothetical protein HU200_040708 [Digitaria exilis]|uniref:Uncharacterized protein n=1 Tax=Digitaria exilis TaxID=1010633 RepID=A0A835BH46_9POAL|nr:hypothetical protein HU200_040708 [Digitaria exilis]